MKITRKAALARMVFAGLATWFKDIPLPGSDETRIPLGTYSWIGSPTPGRSYMEWNGVSILIHEGNTPYEIWKWPEEPIIWDD